MMGQLPVDTVDQQVFACLQMEHYKARTLFWGQTSLKQLLNEDRASLV